MSRPIDEIKDEIDYVKKIRHKDSVGHTELLGLLELELRAAITHNIPLDRLNEICNAERDGRCVVLPCKVGGTAFTVEEALYPCQKCDLDENKRDECYRKKTHFPIRAIHECPKVFYVHEHTVQGFDVSGTLETGAILSLPGEWGYEGLEHFYGSDGKCYFTREEAEKAREAE